LLALSAILLMTLAALFFGVRLLEPHLAFFPVRELAVTPASAGLPFEELTATTSDGLRLSGWYVPPPAGVPASWTLLVFHGNAENIGSGLLLVERAHAAGFGVALAEYRGYTSNPGHPSEQGIYRDGEAFWQALAARRDIDPARIAIWGRSIGGTVAVHLGAAGRGGAVILESPFRSTRTLLKDAGAWFLSALSVFATYRFDQESLIGGIQVPVLILHGTADEVAPFTHGRALFERTRAPKVFVAIAGGGHNDLWSRHAEEVWEPAEAFLLHPPAR
jgi:fermentation-respiration switch protein FrsA (DUF1100 family)